MMKAQAPMECGGLPPLWGAGYTPVPNSGSKLPHSISGGVAAGVAATFALKNLRVGAALFSQYESRLGYTYE